MSQRMSRIILKPAILVLIAIAVMIPLPVAAQSIEGETDLGVIAEGPHSIMPVFIPMVQSAIITDNDSGCPFWIDGGVLCDGPKALPVPTTVDDDGGTGPFMEEKDSSIPG